MHESGGGSYEFLPGIMKYTEPPTVRTIMHQVYEANLSDTRFVYDATPVSIYKDVPVPGHDRPY